MNSETPIREQLDRISRERILILDGAMGSLIQREHLGEADYRGETFAAHGMELAGCNDLLCLTKPSLISAIHEAYLKAGADIVTSCSLNSNAVSMADYGLADRAYEISRAAGKLARRAADKYSTADKPRFAAGSIGPTSKSGSVSPDLDDPGKRGIGWDELEAAYYDSARGLLDGGVHIILLETFFDTLNVKAAAAAVIRLREERGDIPLMISAAISDAAGRLLAGQTVEAFAVSVSHADPWSLGLNCSLGAEKILPHLEALSAFTPFLVSCYPNAGLPDRLGNYTEGPQETAAFMKPFLDRSLVNILGGCCGTTPDHISAIAELAKTYAPRRAENVPAKTFLAGLEILPVGHGKTDFIDIGERTNVAGSRKFLRLVQNQAWEEALEIAREMIAAGARIIDVCMDDALLDGKEAMIRFLNLALSDPEIARVPVMPDSSRWEILEAALKCIQGKSLVNSISLKEGEAEFLRRARLIRRYGAAVVVMLFDEQGQALDYERKIEIAGRSYGLLTETGFPPNDIVFDPNVLTIATGMAEHDRYALDFIRACAWIREHCPGVQISGGISNLSFSFRGNDEIRGALHAVFLKHAINAGLSMAILNPAGLISYDEIRAELRETAENAVLCRSSTTDYAAQLLALTQNESTAGETGTKGGSFGGGNSSGSAVAAVDSAALVWRGLPPEERIIHALVKGIDRYIGEDALELYHNGCSYLEIIEGPLMRGIEKTGDLFGEGKMFLPQVIRSARVMKKAVAALEPWISSKEESLISQKKESSISSTKTRIVLATVKGDVHDIGKNIVALILGCNGYEVIDLGVMAPAEKILQAAKETGAACIGLSALISPSLDEMVRTAEAMEKAGFDIPLLIGGAAASTAHTALRIAPVYSGPVVYVRDAGRTPQAIRSLLSPRYREVFLEKTKTEYEEARRLHEKIAEKRIFLNLEEARSRRFSIDWDTTPLPQPKTAGLTQYNAYPAEKIQARIDWKSFCRSWEISAGPDTAKKSGVEQKLINDALDLLGRITPFLSLRAVIGLFPALSENEEVILYKLKGDLPVSSGIEQARFCFLRNQEKKERAPNFCLADFILPADCQMTRKPQAANPGTELAVHDWLGLFALTAEFQPDALADHTKGDDYAALLAATLANSLAEAFSEVLHEAVQNDLRLNQTPEIFGGIRPAFGYPACPDHRDKETVFALLECKERIGLTLSDSAMIIPASSICGMYFFHPRACYFGTGEIAGDQLGHWAKRKGISLEEARRRTGRI
ncbi:methionine synthase [Spirochaetia bacterium]|nr:methionine synthase [Spirochaetia bacterium]